MPIRGWQRDLDEHSLADQLKAEREEKIAAVRAHPIFRDGETLADFTLEALSRMGYYVTDEILVAVQRIDATDYEKANVADGMELSAIVSRKIASAYGKYMGAFADSRIGMAVIGLWNLRLIAQREQLLTRETSAEFAEAGD
jgi:hypothetical protein